MLVLGTLLLLCALLLLGTLLLLDTLLLVGTNVVTSVFDKNSAKMISATRRIFYMQNLKPS